eukprot:Skav212647  [mRNA]  locus=scaffold681:74402:75124:+ [translate_table: standard]
MCGERRILLTFESATEESKASAWLRCRECKSKWTVPQERLLRMPTAAFFPLLWFCPHTLPCGHSFAKSSWEIRNARLEVNEVELLQLELRGPKVVVFESMEICKSEKLKDDLSKVLQRAEKLVEQNLSSVLRDFRQVGRGQVRKNAWFWSSPSDERALKCALRSRSLMEASYILRQTATKLQAWNMDGTPLVDLGIACYLHSRLYDCKILLDGDIDIPSADSDSEDAFVGQTGVLSLQAR